MREGSIVDPMLEDNLEGGGKEWMTTEKVKVRVINFKKLK